MSSEPGSRAGDGPGASSGPASQVVAGQIRTYVADRGLQPGERLGREEDLAREFGVSRPTLREALRLLASEHLVRAAKGPGGGIFVAATPTQGIGLTISAAVTAMLDAASVEIDELLETRMLLEVPLAGLAAARVGDRDIVELNRLLDDVDAGREDHAVLQAVDDRVHQLISEIADNRVTGVFTQWIVDVLQPRLVSLVRPALVEEVLVEQLRAVIGSIIRRDPVAAERAMREHLLYIRDLANAVEDMNRRTDSGSREQGDRAPDGE